MATYPHLVDGIYEQNQALAELARKKLRLDAMKARWNHIQGTLFPWLREEVDPMTEALGRLVTTLDVVSAT